eukprot:5146950-Pyramimonas_sp.AAC.1
MSALWSAGVESHSMEATMPLSEAPVCSHAASAQDIQQPVGACTLPFKHEIGNFEYTAVSL